MVNENVDLRPYNTFGISVFANKLSTFSSISELTDLLNEVKNEQILILGGGSNVLFTKQFEGHILKNEILGIETIVEDTDSIHLKVGAGVVWHEFVLYCIQNNYGGVENLSLIPGSVGASPMQNIGAYGVEIKDVFVELEALNIKSKQLKKFNLEECQFGYRESVFKRDLKDQYIITSVTYRLSKSNHVLKTGYGDIENKLNSSGIQSPSIKDISDAVIAIRQSKLPNPAELGNAGSFFKNPIVSNEILIKILKNHKDVPNYPAESGYVKLAAGWLIDRAGWKGKNLKTHGVHDRQALVLVNYGTCKGTDIFNLSERIIEDVFVKFGVRLEREVNIY